MKGLFCRNLYLFSCGILLPIVITVFTGQGEILIISMSACLAGFIQNWMIVLPISVVLMIATLFVIKAATKNKAIQK